MTRVCANCGTEVDDEALFCPTCGQPIEAGGQPSLPPAPDWPDTGSSRLASEADAGHDEPGGEPPQPDAPAPVDTTPTAPAEDPYQQDTYVPPWRREQPSESSIDATPDDAADDWSGSSTSAYRHDVDTDAPPPPPRAAASVSAAPPRPGSARAASTSPQGFIETPTTLSGWLVGVGALFGVVGLFLPWYSFGNYTAVWGFANGVNDLVAVVLLAVLAAIFLARMLPDIPHRDLAFAGIGLLGVGIGLDRMGLGGSGFGVVLFVIASLVVAIGGLVSVLGVDRPLGETRS